jgi:hypothetical protein
MWPSSATSRGWFQLGQVSLQQRRNSDKPDFTSRTIADIVHALLQVLARTWAGGRRMPSIVELHPWRQVDASTSRLEQARLEAVAPFTLH